MSNIFRVFCAGSEQREVARLFPLLERYKVFVLVETEPKKIKLLQKSFLVEDISDQYVIRLGDREIDTSLSRINAKGVTKRHPAYKTAKPEPAGYHHYLVQFVGPIKPAWLKAVKDAGGQPRVLYQNFAYVVRAKGKALSRIASLPSVRWVGHLPTWARVATALRRELAGEPEEPLPRSRVRPGVYTVEFFAKDDLVSAAKPVKKLGFSVLDKNPAANLLVLQASDKASVQGKQIQELARVHGVRSIRSRFIKRTCNDVAAGIMGAVSSNNTPVQGLTGRREIIGICDTGLDTGHQDDIHVDFQNRVLWIGSYPITPEFSSAIANPGGDDGAADLASGHGTHVSGSVLGSGAASANLPNQAALIRGLSSEAKLVFQAIEQRMDWINPADLQQNERYILAGLPSDLGTLFATSYTKGARIHSNSWGGGQAGEYDSSCEQVDRFIWKNKNFCILFAAGNDGTDSDGDGVIDQGSVTPPGTAKNCITVGASESRRPDFDDPIADDPNEVAVFSSRGPTRDGRIKPDVVAPGTFILSTRSTQIAPNNGAWAFFPPSRKYFYMGGTSMATPLTAGAVGLIRQYLRTKTKITDPSAALLKAALIAGAQRLPKVGPRGAVHDTDQGYGRVHLAAVLAPKSPTKAAFLDMRKGLRTGEVHAFTIKVTSSKAPLRVVMAYTDFPGRSLVNNLNLVVTSPSGTRYHGNFSIGNDALPPPPRQQGTDGRNNVEVVHALNPRPGKWKIEIFGSNVPHGPQDFALVTLAAL